MRLLRRTASLLAACLLVSMPLPAVVAPAGAGPAASAAGVPMTRVRLHVDRCVHCPVRLAQALPGPPSAHVWRTRAHRVRNGWVTFVVPTRRTRGMSIELDPRWSKLEAISNVVIRYAHTRIGQRIDPATAMHKRRAAGCWAGTTASRVTLRVRVVRFPAVDYAGHRGFAPRAWLARSHAAIPPMVKTFKGAIGNQDAFYCAP